MTDSADSDAACSARCTELEYSVAHLQRLYEQLNSVVTEQSLESARLNRKVADLQAQLKEVKTKQSPESTDLVDEKPPHY